MVHSRQGLKDRESRHRRVVTLRRQTKRVCCPKDLSKHSFFPWQLWQFRANAHHAVVKEEAVHPVSTHVFKLVSQGSGAPQGFPVVFIKPVIMETALFTSSAVTHPYWPPKQIAIVWALLRSRHSNAGGLFVRSVFSSICSHVGLGYSINGKVHGTPPAEIRPPENGDPPSTPLTGTAGD